MKELILKRHQVRKLLLAFLFSIPLVASAYISPGRPHGYVSDFAGFLAPSEVEGLESKLSAFEKNNGAQIAVVTVPSLQGDTIENFSVELFKEWGIGNKGKDNGVLLLIARGEREVRIETGYGLEGALTDAQSAWIIRNVITPLFKQGDFFGGINGAVDKIIVATEGGQIPAEISTDSSGRHADNFAEAWFWIFLFVPMWLASILGRSRSWWAGGVIGGIAGIILGLIYGFVYAGIIGLAALISLGLLFDFLVSRAYASGKDTGRFPWWIGGPPSSGRFGDGFGGFGGGISGGGGASGRW